MTMVSDPPKVNTAGRYPISKAAEILGVDKTTLYKEIYSGGLKERFTRKGKRIMLGSDILMYWRTN